MHKSDLLETEYDQVAYAVQDNEVKIEAVERVSIALPVRELSAQYDELKRKNESLAAEVATLGEYKSKYEAVQLAEEKQRHEAEVASIRKMVESCGCFTEDEIKELEPQIEQEKRLEIQAKIGLRLMESMNSPAEMSSVQEGSMLPKASLEKESPIVFTANDVSRWLNGN